MAYSKTDSRLRYVGQAAASREVAKAVTCEAVDVLKQWLLAVQEALSDVSTARLGDERYRGIGLIREVSNYYRSMGRSGAPIETIHLLRDTLHEAREVVASLEAAERLLVDSEKTGG